MKILIVGVDQVDRDERYMDDKGWSFKKAFDRLGLQTDTFFYKKKGRFSFLEKNRGIKDVWRGMMNKNLVSHVRRTRPDILLMGKAETITLETLVEIRKKTDTVIINVFPDNPLYMGNFETIAPCHFFFVKDSYVLETLHKAGLDNVFYLPQCTDPDVHRPLELTSGDKAEYEADLTLIGSMYPYRLKFLEQLLEFRPTVWGRGWSRSGNGEIAKIYRGRDIRGSRKAKAICGAAISLNPHHPLNDINGVNRRTYDIAGCRGFQLADLKPDMQRVFSVGNEIVCYSTLDELKSLVRYYLDRPAERNQIAEAAYNRVIREHTYDVRARQILDIAGGLLS
jgi:spore maturation protein CgeB